jgi:hypothetical protein
VSLPSELWKLYNLKVAGCLTELEFKAAKKIVLASAKHGQLTGHLSSELDELFSLRQSGVHDDEDFAEAKKVLFLHTVRLGKK